MNRSFAFVFAAVCAAGLSFPASAETWTWIGGSTWGWKGNGVIADMSPDSADRKRDWLDGYNWQDSSGVRGDHYKQGTHLPQHGDVIVFDTNGQNEYTHCYGGGSGVDYGGILFKGSKAWSGYFGSQPVVKDGFVSNTIPKNVNLAYMMGAGTVELYCCSGGSLQLQLLKKSAANAATYVKTGPGTFRWQENGTSAYSTFDLREGKVLMQKDGLLDGGTTKFLMSGPQTELDLNGFSQNVKCAFEQTAADTMITSSSNPAVLLLSGAQDDTSIIGKISGQTSICWSPDDETKALTLSGGVCDTTGTMIVSNGVVALAAGTTLANARFDVEGGRLEFRAKTSLAVGRVTVNDEVVGDGIYTGSGSVGQQVDWLSGDQIVVIGVGGETGDTVEATWNGSGDLSTVANWRDAADLPPLGKGSVKMLVAGGTSATVDRNYWIRGIEIDSGVSTFGFGGTSLLWLGSLGLKTPGAGGTYTLGAPLGLTTAQTWTVGAGDTLNLVAAIQTVAPGTVTLNGPGTVNANVAQPDLANDICVNGGKLVVTADGGLGTGETFLNTTNGVLDLQANRYDGAITVTGGGPAGAWGLRSSNNYVFNGCFTRHLDGVSVNPDSGKTWTFAGGLTLAPNTTHTFNGAGTIVITNRPFNGGYSTRVNFTAGQTHIYTTGNDINSAQQGWIVGQSTVFYTHVPYAINGGYFNIAGNQGNYGTWDLCGCDQKVDSIQCGRGNNNGTGAEAWKTGTAPGTIVSELPAMLHDVSSGNRTNPSSSSSPSSTNWAYFVGQAGISKDGSYKGLWLNQECMSSGTVQVTKQKLYFSKKFVDAQGNDYGTGSWPNAAKAIAKDAGTLVFEHSNAIGKKTDVIIEGNGKVQLDAGVNQRCADLYFGDERQELGTWGSSESAATHKDARFTGTGILTVRGQNPGLILLIR